MANTDSQQITSLLVDWSNGNQDALDNLMPLVYDELRRIARRFMRRQAAGHTFQTTELIHEAYLKLARSEDQNWQNHAHSKQSRKRGGFQEKVTLDETAAVSFQRHDEMVLLDDAMKQLAALDER